MQIEVSQLRQRVHTVLVDAGFAADDADRVTDVLVFADRTGKATQGVAKLFGTEPVQRFAPPAPATVAHRHAVSAFVDGHGCAGPLVGSIAVEEAARLARTTGIAVVGATGIRSSTGALSYYAHRLANDGLVSIVMANAPRTTAPPGVRGPLFGTNPVGFGVPAPGGAAIVDLSTSAMTWSGLVRAAMLGETIPEGVAVDRDARPTTDPDVAMAGALLPFGGSAKGGALALAVELLAGALTGSDVVFDDGDWGFFVIAFARDLVVAATDVHARTDDALTRLAATDGYRVPGRTIDEALAARTVELDDRLWRDLQTLGG